MKPERILIEAAHDLARNLPAGTADVVAEAILTCGENSLRAEITKRVPHHQHRELALAFIDRWRDHADSVDRRAVGMALQTATLSEQAHRDSQSLELVWTGPDVEETSVRRTEQAILQLIDGAKERITLVSFAVYRIANVGKALVKAAKRGVKLTVVVETPDKVEGEGEYDTIRALGKEVAACSNVYYWPRESRPISDTKKTALLHVKCAVADGEWLFLSSANLTRQAFLINMELGLLVHGGSIPGRVEEQFAALIRSEQLRPV